MFEVIDGGIETTIQDLGRCKQSHLGVKSLGALDEYAYLWSQKLLENSEANALEILLGGLKVKATKDTIISVCGGDLGFKINGKQKPIWQTYNIYKDDVITFSSRKSGLRVYFAVKDGFVSEKIYGSFSTTTKLKRGDLLLFKPSHKQYTKRVPQTYIPNYTNELILKVLLSYQHQYFSTKQKELFFNSTYRLSSDINRMGYKLTGNSIVPKRGDIISEGIAFGSIQIPADGQPIILLKDRQTIGGYPKIGVVLASDCFKLAQLPIGSTVKFKKITISHAQKQMSEFYKLFSNY